MMFKIDCFLSMNFIMNKLFAYLGEERALMEVAASVWESEKANMIRSCCIRVRKRLQYD